ncbi:MAG: TIGR00282 family metallophosphoesterase [Pseudomonadota bacterium]
MRVMFLGDLVGRSGREAVFEQVPHLRQQLALDFVVVNAENAAGGFGLTESICFELFDAGVDVITSGNHIWDQKTSHEFIDAETRVLRPINYPSTAPGRGYGLFDSQSGHRVLVVNAMARVFMEPLDDPFAGVERALASVLLGSDCDFALVDFHGEATSEKMAMGHFVDGRASLCVGTHSHVPTADAQILDGGTAYQTDAGMCGDYNSVIGMDPQEPLQRFTRKISSGRFIPAQGAATVCGVVVESDEKTGLALSIEPVRIGGRLKEVIPSLVTS